MAPPGFRSGANSYASIWYGDPGEPMTDLGAASVDLVWGSNEGAALSNIKAAFRLLLQSKLNTSQAVEAIRQKNPAPEVELLLRFIETSERGVIK